MNMICRKDSLRAEIFERLRDHWKYMTLNQLKKSRNDILICTNDENVKLADNLPFSDIDNIDVKSLFESVIHVAV
jgi:hypothetical protein